jgi:hypothetical protein
MAKATMTLVQLLTELKKRDVNIYWVDGRIKLVGPPDAFTPEIDKALRRYKWQLKYFAEGFPRKQLIYGARGWNVTDTKGKRAASVLVRQDGKVVVPMEWADAVSHALAKLSPGPPSQHRRDRQAGDRTGRPPFGPIC